MSGRRVALVVATDRYDDGTLRGLAAPASDAEALAEVLGDPELGDFEVSVLANARSWEIGEQVDAVLGGRKSSDLVLLHFSCHGLKDDSGELYLAATNTRPDRLTTTAVDAALVSRLMRRSRAQRIVLLLDCCYGGAFERGVVARAGEDVHVGEQFTPTALAGGRGRVVITASSAMEYAFEGTELTLGGRPAPSLFTSALVDGIRTGAADRDHDGWVSLDELYDYVFDSVQALTPNQTPGRWEFGVQGELIVAHNPHQVVAAHVQPEVLERAKGGSVDERLSAVDELARLAGGTDLAMAAGAAGALAPLLSDGNRWVSTAAQAALDAIRPRPDEHHIDLGRVPSGRPVLAELRVHGSPLALASTVQTSAPEVSAQLEAGLLSVRVIPSRPGPVEATVTMSGAAGEAHVDVRAEVPARDPSLPVVVPLVLVGAAAIAAAWWRKGEPPDTEFAKTVRLLALPAVACLLAAPALAVRALRPVAVGTIAGTAAWAVILWARDVAAVASGPETEVAGEHWLRLTGGLLLGLAAVLVVRATPDLRERVHYRRGRRSGVASVIVVAGALVPVIALPFQDLGDPPVVVTEWALVLAVCLPALWFRFNEGQRHAALTGVVVLCLFTAARAGWVVVADAPDPHPHLSVTVVAAVIVLAGCLLRLAQPTPVHGRASYPPGVAQPG